MKQQQFFGGDGANLGLVAPLPVSNWREFVNALLGHPVIIPVAREGFHAMDKEHRDTVKRVRYVTPALFPDAGKRVTERATGFSLVALDIDDSEQALPLYHNPQSVRDALAPFGFAMYSTARSTPEAPRLRIFVRADGMMPIDVYSRAVNTLADRLGLPSVTKESYVVVQPMYLPSMFRGEDPLIFHPLLASDTEGRGMELTDLLSNEEHKSGEKKAASSSLDDLDYLRPTVDGIVLDDAKEALGHINPDVKMAEWIEMGAALKHQFNEVGFALWEEWSRKGTKYPGDEKLRYRWDSLKANPRGRAPVTIRSLFFRAQEAGWNGAAVGTRCYESILRWMTEADADQLLSLGLKKIAAAPMVSPLEKGVLITDLQNALKREGRRVSRTDLQIEMKRLERLAKSPQTTGRTDDKDLPPWARGICYVLGTDEFYVYAAQRRLSPAVLDASMSQYLMTPDSVDTGKPLVLPRHFLLNLHRITQVDHYRYDPSYREGVFFDSGKHKFVNTYVADYPEADLGRMEEAGELFWNHLLTLTGNVDHARTLMDFLAYQAQVPGGKIRWAVLVQGAEGAGKGFVADALKAVLGRENVKEVNGTSLLNRDYNEWAKGAQVVCIDEVRVAGQNRFEVMNKLKPLITNTSVSINEKFENLIEVPNCSNYLLFTNHRDALALSEGDRRYFVIHSPLQTKGHVEALGGAYFNKLYGMLHENAGGLRAWFEQWRISPDFRPDDSAPQTEHRAELIESTASPLMQAVRECLTESENPLIQPDLLSILRLRQQIELNGQLPYDTTMTGLASVLRELGYVHAKTRLHLADEKHQLWQPLDKPHGEDCASVAKNRIQGGNLL